MVDVTQRKREILHTVRAVATHAAVLCQQNVPSKLPAERPCVLLGCAMDLCTKGGKAHSDVRLGEAVVVVQSPCLWLTRMVFVKHGKQRFVTRGCLAAALHCVPAGVQAPGPQVARHAGVRRGAVLEDTGAQAGAYVCTRVVLGGPMYTSGVRYVCYGNQLSLPAACLPNGTYQATRTYRRVPHTPRAL